MRIQTEKQKLLSGTLKNGKNIELNLSNRGAIIRSIKVNGTLTTRDVPEEKTKPGDRGGFFIAPIVFGRLINRSLVFKNHTYSMPFPEDINPTEVDPEGLYAHGIHHYYTFEEKAHSSTKISYLLDHTRLPESYPFPHSCEITYQLTDTGFKVCVTVKACEVPVPAQLTIHPFFRYFLENDNKKQNSIQFRGRLSAKFELEPGSKLPLPTRSPTKLADGGPYTQWTSLGTDTDHSFISEDGITELRWPNSGPHIRMVDESELSEKEDCKYPVQIWTTGGITRNACAIEQGGPANCFYLVANNLVDHELLPVALPGKDVSRTVRYEFL
ncbi:MAG TPA: hypothetical protein PKA63_14305 [Oligoflexia bacterium]|nr:hypothetical protein [Oligoflexia bacterium]HMP49837.1 hypothetical protein [Oligoflexia bacterium]